MGPETFRRSPTAADAIMRNRSSPCTFCKLPFIDAPSLQCVDVDVKVLALRIAEADGLYLREPNVGTVRNFEQRRNAHAAVCTDPSQIGHEDRCAVGRAQHHLGIDADQTLVGRSSPVVGEAADDFPFHARTTLTLVHQQAVNPPSTLMHWPVT